MVDGKVLEKIYMESLEEDIISHLAVLRGISLETAMDKYYNSKLSEKIQNGIYGIQYLDYRTLCDIIIETEPDLFAQ